MPSCVELKWVDCFYTSFLGTSNKLGHINCFILFAMKQNPIKWNLLIVWFIAGISPEVVEIGTGDFHIKILSTLSMLSKSMHETDGCLWFAQGWELSLNTVEGGLHVEMSSI